MDATPDLLQRFGARLREERLRSGYSQEQLADRAKLDRTYVSGVERGVRNLGLRNIGALATALGLEPAYLLRSTSSKAADPDGASSGPTYAYDPDVTIECEFAVEAIHVIAAFGQTNRALQSLPLRLFTTIDLKTQSSIVGAMFAAELAALVGAITNPIEKGHPDIVPASASSASELELRNYPVGLEIKSTLGGVVKDSQLGGGQARIDALKSITWQAHHREVRALMGLIWDFVGGTKSHLTHPCITGAFYTDRLRIDDWGEIAGTTGRNTKVTGMTASGRKKMGTGAIAVIDDAGYQQCYAACMSVPHFDTLRLRGG